MINGFEEITAPLTEMEKKILPVIVRGLSEKVGPANAVTNKSICAGLLNNYKVNIKEARIRKIINHIRMNYMIPGLVANSTGYYISKDAQEVKRYIESLEGREKAIRGIREKTQHYLRELTHKQQTLLFVK